MKSLTIPTDKDRVITMKNVGFVGWRGMVGSVLMQRMVEERDFDGINPVFFTTSQLGEAAPAYGNHRSTLQDAYDIDTLASLDIIISCQGVITPMIFIPNYVKRVGKVIGLMRHLHYA